MCGRFTLHTEKELLERQFQVDLDGLGVRASYNIAPSQDILVVRTRQEQRVARQMRWGLVPHWARPLEKLPPMINARIETVHRKPAYRLPFRRRRCWVLADGFYEWQSLDRNIPRQPHWISLESRQPFAMAGIWDVWFPSDEPDTEPLITCSIVTAPANSAIEIIHPRMPVILRPEAAAAWIDPALDDQVEELLSLLEPVPAEALAARPVSDAVNSPDNDSPLLIEPSAPRAPTLF